MQANEPVITLTSDFGYSDPFAGVMKGVILGINPNARIVDLTHGISPQDVKEAAFSLAVSYRFFPENTVHVVVVDPGVGSGRRALIVSCGGQYFVGPDNGVFSYVYAFSPETPEVIHVTAGRYFLSSESPTFQGRDVFAPVAAWLSTGVNLQEFGTSVTDYRRFDVPSPDFTEENSLTGEVIHIDRFGNAITNISSGDMERLCVKSGRSALKITFNGGEVPLREFYSDAGGSGLSSLVNSWGHLELFVNCGNASAGHSIAIGDKVGVGAVPGDKR